MSIFTSPWYDILGWIGALLILGGYFALNYDFLTQRTHSYQTINIIGALFLLIGAWIHGAYFVVFLQSMWILISLGKVIQLMRKDIVLNDTRSQ